MKQLEAAAGDLSRDAVVPAKAVLKITSMTDAFRVELADHRPAVVKQTCGLLGALAWACGASFTCVVEALLVPILLMAIKKKQTKVIATAARHCLDCMAKASRFAIVILEKTYHHAKQDDALRMMCLSLVELVLRHGDVDNVMSREVYIPPRRLILKTLRDHNVAVQTHGRMALCLLCEYGQECIAELRHVVDTDLLELAMAEYPESLLATTGRQPEEVATEASMLCVIPEGDEGDVANAWDDLSTRRPAGLERVETIEDEDNGADENWRESAMAAVANKLDDSWDDLSTVLITELSPPQSGDQLDWSESMIEVDAHDDGADNDWREPAVAAVATQFDNSWDDLALSSTSSVIDVPTLDSTRGRDRDSPPSKIHPAMVQPLSAALAITGPPAHSLPLPKFCVPSSINRTIVPTENERKAVISPDQSVATNNATAPADHIDGARPSVQVGRRRSYLSLVWETMWRILWVGYVMFAVVGVNDAQLEALTKTVVEWTAAMNVPKHQVQLPFEESHKVSWDTVMEDLRRRLELEPMARHGS
ncbi:hypothetical protein H257_17076 [Aphanomyces astaci]|uniref:CLASP N-terminal domain-containing protein n=1 Tax=Aphanomyces astaci TaxID=112090 RepID=W4FG68_APHAT|nr:hypothetical protein H257_17076 [Aphanomyces astaci]ETV66507.1 hypothetical protein H257_17076 [Aphanomyces astaci]|eukprot:XP_009844036.1 hypothetical protein H257_17076 [Aphanomyces astaci]